MSVVDLIRAVGVAGWFDIALMAALIYAALSWTRRTTAPAAIAGIVALAVLYLIARQFGLALTATVFERFFAVILIALIVLFQGELRTMFEQVASLGRGRLRFGKAGASGGDQLASMLARTAFDLSRQRIGALIVLPGARSLRPFASGGVELDGRPSVPLLKSIFDHHSPGHDGALVVEGGRIARFAVHLPLSTNAEARGEGGTRHAAALGITERTDALCLVVSEERGVVSVARDGQLTPFDDAAELFDALDGFLRAHAPSRPSPPRLAWLTRDWRSKLIALCVATGMWVVLVAGARSTYRTFPVPVEVIDTATGAAWVATPAEVQVTLRGPLRSFWLAREDALAIRIDAGKPPAAGERLVTADALSRPEELVVEQLLPQRVHIEPAAPAAPAD